MPAELSIQVLNFAENPSSWEPFFAFARLADRLGIDRLVVSEHVLYGENLDAYADPKSGGTRGGKQPTTPDGHWLDPLTTLTWIAATTERVRVGTAILLAALRPPPLLAKQAATLDVFSGGRLDLGVGVGWQREEYEACGLDFAERGALLDRCLDVCQQLWRDVVVDYDDGDLKLERIHQMPKPVQPGGVPFWVSGRVNPRTLRRVARFGTGWIPWGDDIADPKPGIAAMRDAFEKAGRDPATLLVQGTLPVVRNAGMIDVAATMDAVPALLEAGVTDFRFHNRWGADLVADEALLAEAVPTFRAAVGRAD